MNRWLLIVVIALLLSACKLLDQLDDAVITVAGRVTDDGQPVAGVIVLLVKSSDAVEGLSLANGSITDSRGEYLILDVKSGSYYLMAVEDRNGNLQYDRQIDRLGFYGVNPAGQDFEPDLFRVHAKDMTSINVTDLYSLAAD